jgi:acyl-CoA synthetase (AMP-forming)/AMP-acid ligase II
VNARGSVLRWDEDAVLAPATRRRLTGPGAPFEMADVDVLGTRVRGFVRRPRSVTAMLQSAAERLGEEPAFVFPDRALTFAGLHRAAAAVAGGLRDRFGVTAGDRVAIAAANIAGQPVVAWAAAMLGAVVVELNGWWTGEELAAGLELTTPTALCADARRAERLERPACPVVGLEDGLSSLEAHPAPVAAPAPVAEDDPLVVLFTSGTTGRPRGVTLSHRAAVHWAMQASLQGAVARAVGGMTPPGAPGPTIGVSPMFHVSGFVTQLIGAAYTGATYVYPSPGRWDEQTHLQLTARHRATAWSLVPAQLWRLLDHPAFDRTDLSSLTRIGGGGATFDPELWEQVRRRLPGVRMATGYGMSETCGAGTHHDGEDALEHPDALGRPGPGTEIKVVDLADPAGATVPDGEVGQICLRGASTMLGYWCDPAATAAALDDDRWYRTGELGHVAGGLLYLEGRGSELIVRGGENVYPVEIENRLLAHPGIVEAAVIGVPHRTLGEEVAAIVVPADGVDLSPAAVRAWVDGHLAPFKVPAYVEVVDGLPRNAAGKVVKAQIPRPGARARVAPPER